MRMLTGVNALQQIDQTLLNLRNEASAIDAQNNQYSELLARANDERLRILQEIGRVRIEEIGQGTVDINYDEQFVINTLRQREQEIEALSQRIMQLQQELLQQEQQRDQQLERVNQCSKELDDIEASVQQQLEQDQNYQERLRIAQEADDKSSEASTKAENAKRLLQEKAEPYQNDKLFMYLWQRRYGTADYQAGLISRYLDDWVADLIHYDDNRENYWNLQEIPKRLDEHARTMATQADNEQDKVVGLEQAALEQAGGKAKEQELHTLRNQLDALDDAIAELEQRHDSALDDRALYHTGDDQTLKQCLKQMAQLLKNKDIDQIRAYVRQTRNRSDDSLINNLHDIELQIEEAEDGLFEIQKSHRSQMQRLRDLERVRQRFKQSRYDDIRSGFANGSLLNNLLQEFIKGIATADHVWGYLRKNQRYHRVQSVPDFGSGGLGASLEDLIGEQIYRHRRRRSSGWHMPRPRGGGGGFRLPRGGGGGGFRTGGGF